MSAPHMTRELLKYICSRTTTSPDVLRRVQAALKAGQLVAPMPMGSSLSVEGGAWMQRVAGGAECPPQQPEERVGGHLGSEPSRRGKHLDQLAKARGVVVAQRLGVTEGLQQRIRLQDPGLNSRAACKAAGSLTFASVHISVAVQVHVTKAVSEQRPGACPSASATEGLGLPTVRCQLRLQSLTEPPENNSKR